MASILTSSGWMTSFIYKQDLTSYYMNNVLTGTFRPGVYNANIAVVMNNDDVFLSIKKGTTLLFSNNYISYGPHGKRRNFSGTDNLNYNVANQTNSDSLVMIKCVAQNDIIQKIANTSDIFIENSPRELYVFAYVEYQKSSEEGTESVPYFRLASAQSTTRESAVNVTSANFLYKTVYPAFDYNRGTITAPKDEKDQSYWLLPDGCIDYTVQTSVRNIANFSFLMLGVLSCDSLISDNSEKHYHMTFTGRGLPEYRYSMISDHNSMAPAFIIDQRTGDSGYCANGFLDMPDTLISDVLFNQRIVTGEYGDLSWEQLYDNNDKITGIDLATRNINFIVNGIDSKNVSPGLVIDFIFGVTKSTSIATQEINFLSQEASISLAKETVIQYFDTIENNIFNTLSYYDDDYWVETSSVVNVNTSSRVIPLDICERNISRLSSLIQNKNLWEQVIDKYRIDHNMSGFTDIIPIAIAFRIFSGKNSSITHCHMSDNTALYFGSYLDTTSRVNPINVLSYFDLIQKKYKVNVLDTKSSNIYNQIPIR